MIISQKLPSWALSTRSLSLYYISRSYYTPLFTKHDMQKQRLICSVYMRGRNLRSVSNPRQRTGIFGCSVGGWKLNLLAIHDLIILDFKCSGGQKTLFLLFSPLLLSWCFRAEEYPGISAAAWALFSFLMAVGEVHSLRVLRTVCPFKRPALGLWSFFQARS